MAVGDNQPYNPLSDRTEIENPNSYNRISTATTTVIKTGEGHLHRIVVTGGTAGTIKVYDNTAGSGTLIADIGSTNALGSYEFNVNFQVGLTIVTSAATLITVAYR